MCVEKTGDVDRNQSPGSIVWVAHGTVLLRCAPEQLRPVTHSVRNLSELFWDHMTPSEILKEAKNSQRYHNIVPEAEQMTDSDDIHDENPDDDTTLLKLHTDPSVEGIPRYRAFGKQKPYDGSSDFAGSSAKQGSHQQSELRGDGSERAGQPEAAGGQASGSNVQDHRGERGELRSLAPRPSKPEREVSASPDLHPPPGRRESQERRSSVRKDQGLLRSSEGHNVPRQARREFDEYLDRERSRRHQSPAAEEHPGDPAHDLRGTGPDQDSVEPSGTALSTDPRSSHDSPGTIPETAGGHERPLQSHDPDGAADRGFASHGGTSSSSRLRSRSRHRGQQLSAFHSELPEVESDESLSLIQEEYSVGCSLQKPKECGSEGVASSFSRGCFEWMGESEDSALESELPTNNFVCASDEVLEIQMTVAPRDVHCQRRNGVAEWVLNPKPKKNAEVSFKKLSPEEQVEMKKAMKSEVSSFLEREAIEIAAKQGIDPQKLLTMRWVLTYKPVMNDQGEISGTKPKARLIIRGFEDPNLLSLRRDSPTLALSNRNALLALSAIYHWPIFAGDIKTAFLNGDVLPECEHLFGDPPQEAREILGMKDHEMLRIKKVIYGLLNAPRAWLDKLARVLAEQGWQRSRLEQCVWRLFDKSGQLVGLLGCHVDDILCSGKGSYFEERIQLLRSSFPFGSWQKAQEETITFCGCEVSQDSLFNIYVSQERYALGLSEIGVSTSRKKEPSAPATPSETKQLRAALGGLSWRATQSCPWLAASVSVLQGCQKNPKVEHLLQVNKLIREQRHRCDVPVKFSSAIQRPVLVTYTDASYACRMDDSSQGGQLTLLADMGILQGERSEYSLLSWQSRKLARVARSSTSAEVQMASNATDSHEFTKQVLLEWFNMDNLGLQEMEERMQAVPSVLIMDSKNLYDAMSRIETSGLQLEEKRVAIEILSIRERTQQTGICVKWCDSDQQLADGLSKPFHYDQLVDLLSLGVISVIFDPLFTSAKKKRQMLRQERLEKTHHALVHGDSRSKSRRKEIGENPTCPS